MPPVDRARWFGEEVKPHEPALRAYLQARFSSLSDHDDLVQETTIAHNIALDLFRRRRVVPVESVTDMAEADVLEKEPVVSDTGPPGCSAHH